MPVCSICLVVNSIFNVITVYDNFLKSFISLLLGKASNRTGMIPMELNSCPQNIKIAGEAT